MRTIYIRTVLAAMIVAAGATRAVAQESPVLLTSIEVRRLVMMNQPADHARLRDHFGMLAKKFRTDARRYREMARVMTGNPNHPFAVSPGIRWMKLADSAERSAATLSELSAHHGRLADGLPSQAPIDSARFEAGYGAPAPSDSYIHELVSGARTRTDHMSLADYFNATVQQQMKTARKYDAAARAYRGPVSRIGGGNLAPHYELMAEQSRVKANEARAEATKQRQLAQGD